jgi:seryl-tRNA synthetase
MQALELPYRVVNIGVAELGSSAAKKYDIEAWMPGQGAYREVTSTSNTTDFQARRLDIRYRPEGGKPAHVPHRCSTAVTWRHMIAIIENGQQDDGSVTIPAVLQRWGAPAVLRVGDSA